MIAANTSAGKLDVTVDEYHRMGERGQFAMDARVELIKGEIVKMTPIGCQHAGTVKRLARRCNEALGHLCIVSVQDPIILGEYSEPEPDLALLLPRNDFYSTSHPTAADVQLLVEVAESSLHHDREIKLPLYASHGIPEVWLVDLDGNCLTICSRPVDGQYARQDNATSLGAIAPQMASKIALDLSDLFQ